MDRSSQYKIIAIYAVMGGLWILFSDRFLASLIEDPSSLTRFQTLKGWLYVGITAGILFLLLRRYAAESEEFFRITFEQASVGLAHVAPDGKWMRVNRRLCDIAGYDHNELLGLTFRDITHPEDLDTDLAHFRRMLEGELHTYTVEKRYIRKDRSLIWINLTVSLVHGKRGNPEYFIFVIEDITGRKMTEEALRRSEENLNAAQELANLGSWEWDVRSQQGYWSRHMFRMFGMEPADKPPGVEAYLRLIHPGDRGMLKETLDRMREGQEPAVREFRSNPGHGPVRYFYPSYHLTKDHEGRPAKFSGTLLDITERHEAAEEIRIANEELISINRIVSAITGVPDLREILEKVMDQALLITGLEGGTICLVTPDGTLQLAAHRATSEAALTDLTTQEVKIGDCLCGECARDHTPLILWDREAVLQFSTREAARGEDIRFHAAFPLLTGNRCLGVLCLFSRTDFKPSERRMKLIETVTSQIALSVANAQLFEESARYSETLERTVGDRTRALQENQKALMNIVEDLNEAKMALQAANARLKELDRMKSMFIASMSHELRTPLNSIIGFSSIIQNEWLGPVNKEQKENLTIILRAGKHLLNLINDVIDVSKIEAGKVDSRTEAFDVHGLILEAAELLKKEAEVKGLGFTVESEHVVLHADRRRLLQCVTNLLSNAVKFTERGSVRVQARIGSWASGQGPGKDRGMIHEASTLLHTAGYPTASSGDIVEIIVEDTGIGIADEDRDRLFMPFSRLESARKLSIPGTGLGLYLTKKLVTEVLKGSVEVQSSIGTGSTFRVIIPLGMKP